MSDHRPTVSEVWWAFLGCVAKLLWRVGSELAANNGHLFFLTIWAAKLCCVWRYTSDHAVTRRLAKCRLNSGLHTPHGVRPSLALDTIPADTRRLEKDRRCGDCIDCKQPLIETYRFVRTYLPLLKLPQAAWICCRAVVGQLGDHRAACARSRLLARRAACSHTGASIGSRRAGSRRRRRAGGSPTMAGADHRAGHSPR